jgi:hypothetical protein
LGTFAKPEKTRLIERAWLAPSAKGTLHGLNHIATPQERAALIDPFLQLPRDKKLLAYARACRSGHAQ